jgi:phosphatidylglycerophosphatase A
VWAVLPPGAAIQAAVILLILVAGAWAGGAAERHFHSTDPGPVVIDEVMGMLVTLFMNPVGWSGALAGFLIFRVFDVIKPYPANRLERLHGGIGVMADDFMSGIYANLVLRALLAALA